MSAENLSADPNGHDLFGLPGVEAEQPKIYFRRLWLPAENDRTTYPKIYDTNIIKMAQLAVSAQVSPLALYRLGCICR